MRKSLILCLLGTLLLYSCDGNRVYEKNIDFEGRVWAEPAIQEFQFDIEDSGKQYDIYLNIRNSLLYPFQNLYTTIVLEDSLGNELSRTLKNSALFDETTGEPLGKGLGDLFDHQIPVFNTYTFPEKGRYSIFVSQSMRMDTLNEVMAIGIRIETVEKKK